MSTFQIEDAELTGVNGKVAIVTGGSSGIGLATVDLLVSLGARVVIGDIQAPQSTGDLLFVRANVNSWTDQIKLFKTALDTYGRIDYVFANAGIGPRADFLNLAVDEHGDPSYPDKATLDTDLQAVVNTAVLAVHYLKSQPEGGSIVLTGSTSGLQPFRAVDYATAKTGVLGLGRSLAVLLEAADIPVRVNVISPSWTDTQLRPDLKDVLRAVSVDCQPPSVVARAVAHLFVNPSRNGETIYISDGQYKEIEKSVLSPAYESIKGNTLSDDAVLARVLALDAAAASSPEE